MRFRTCVPQYVVVIVVALFGWIAIARGIFGSLEDVWVLVVTLFVGAPLFCAMSVAVWRFLLIRLGVISREEAHGYPYSRPWIERL